jgi:NAD(P) transhydrogenase
VLNLLFFSLALLHQVLSWARMNEIRPNPDSLKETFNTRFHTFLEYAVTLVSHELMGRLGTGGVTLVRGEGKLESTGLMVKRPGGEKAVALKAEKVALCVGSRPARPPGVPFDGVRVLDGEEISKISCLPNSIVIIGGGIIAMEYATIFGCLGVQTHVINSHAGFLPMLESGLCSSLISAMEAEGVQFHHQVKVQEWSGGNDEQVTVTLSNGKELTVDTVLYGQGREGSTDDVASSDVALDWGKRGYLNNAKKDFSVGPPGVFAIGDVVGGGLASTAADHGEALAENLFGSGTRACGAPCPLVLWTIPEVASVGLTKEKAAEEKRSVVSARAEFRELPRGLLSGDLNGYLDMLVDQESGEIVGAHLIGPGSSELVHFGASLISNKTTVSQLAQQVFAAVTLHCLFHVAAERAEAQIKKTQIKTLGTPLVGQ